jgi:hypothetical protein
MRLPSCRACRTRRLPDGPTAHALADAQLARGAVAAQQASDEHEEEQTLDGGAGGESTNTDGSTSLPPPGPANRRYFGVYPVDPYASAGI